MGTFFQNLDFADVIKKKILEDQISEKNYWKVTNTNPPPSMVMVQWPSA